jgi:hypothetical protein
MKTKNFVKRLIVTLFVLFIFQTSFCQENYLPGYIITLKGDTLHGFIDYRNWDRNPDKISFKEKLSDNKLNYSPSIIKGFGVLDEVYESAIVETEISSDQTNNLQYNNELQINVDTTFLQAMIKGEKSLYYYKNKFGRDQFYIKKGSSYELLVYKKYLKDQEGQTTIRENKRYLGQLTIYFQDSPAMKSKINTTGYEKKSMENLFLSYYKSIKSDIKFQKKTERISTELGVLAGMSLTSLKFSGDDFPSLVKAGYPQSVNIATGVFFDFVLPRNQRKWSLYNELIFTSYKVKGCYKDYEHENKYTITHTTIGYSYIKVNNMLRYKYPVGKLFVYVNGGVSNGYAISENNYRKTETKFYSTESTKEGLAVDGAKRYEFGYILGLGAKLKKYSFEIRYEKGNGMSDFSSLTSATKRFYFLLGYRF